MRILVTGAKGFVGRNLCAQLKNIRDGKACCYGNVTVDEVMEYDQKTRRSLCKAISGLPLRCSTR